jgi:hypothetical protein
MDIGTPQRIIEVEPEPVRAPSEPLPAPEPLRTPEPEPAPEPVRTS